MNALTNVAASDRVEFPADRDFQLFFDKSLSRPTPYHDGGNYFRKSRTRLDQTFELIRSEMPDSHTLDIGASPFYLLDKAKAAGARRASGLYFANDDHPLKGTDRIFSRHGAIDLTHANIETEALPFATDSVDVVTACEILEHCEYFPLLLANEIRRVLRPGGLLCITVPNVASVANIVKLVFQKNIYMKYRSDPTGRHKHEYTMAELRAFVGFLDMDIVRTGHIAAATSDKWWLKPAYAAIGALPLIRRYSPKLYILARQRSPKPAGHLKTPPRLLYDDALSIED